MLTRISLSKCPLEFKSRRDFGVMTGTGVVVSPVALVSLEKQNCAVINV